MASEPVRIHPAPTSSRPVRLVPPRDAAGGGNAANGGFWKESFAIPFKVPASGILYLGQDEVSSALEPLVPERTGALIGASLIVSPADNTRAYKLSIKKNGSEVALLSLAATQTKVTNSVLSLPYTAGDEYSVSIEKTSGTGSSTFTSARATLAFQDD